MKCIFRIAVLVSLVAMTGCLTQPTCFVASSVPMTQGEYSVLGLEVRGTSTQVSWLFFTFGAHGSSQRHALEDALSQAEGADGLTAMSVDSETFSIMPTSLISFPIFPTFYKIVVTGTPVKLNVN